MALKFIKKGEAKAPEATAPAVSTTATPAAPEVKAATPDKPKKGQAKRLPVDGIRLDLPMRLRTGHMLSLFAVSGAQFYKLRKAGKIPEPAGHVGTGKRPAPYWISTEIAPFILGG
jgi:hypothetical protein